MSYSENVEVAVHVEDKFVVIELEGVMEDREDADRYQGDLQYALSTSGNNRVLMDNREGDGAPKKVIDYMWSWIESNAQIERLAMVVSSEMLKIGIRMTALGRGVNAQAFLSMREARAWLEEDDECAEALKECFEETAIRRASGA